MTLTFTDFRDLDGLPEQRALFGIAFPEHRGKPAASEEHYQWKFHGAPHTPPSYEYIANEQGRMVGYYAAIPYTYKIGKHMTTAGMVCDVMTHPEARGKGVFTRLGSFGLKEMGAAGLDFAMGYPIRDEVMGGHLRVGWRVAFELPMYLRPLKADSIMKSKRVSFLTFPANVGIAIHRAITRSWQSMRRYEGVVSSPCDLVQRDDFAAFRQKWELNVKNHLIKAADFYEWRLSAPGTNYQAFAVYDKGSVVATAIGREANLYGIPSYALLDLMVLRGKERALARLFRDINNEAVNRNAEAVVMVMSKYRARQHRLLRYGFLKSPFTFKVILRSLNPNLEFDRLSSEKGWHLMWIDSDDL